ncbi:MAG TPA: HD domain-containing protein [Armatimonadota bacterium]|jgi:3'-5' exoribonuclease
MPKTMLADIRDGMSVQTLAYLKQKRLIPFKNKPGAFLALTLADSSGSLEAKVFDGAEDMHARLHDGQILSVAGRASVYQGSLGLVLDAADVWDGPLQMADFMPAYAGDVAELDAQLDALIASLTDSDISRLVHAIFADPDLRAKYREAPAAKSMHGAYLHGLLEHVVRQAELAEAACHCYPQAKRDLVIAGVLLHDIGKIVEFSWGLSIEYTKYGQLQGHAIIGDRLVFERGREVGISEETALQLSHMLLSHHGEREFGAVVLPQTLEAVILHSVDNLEAKATHCIAMLAKADPTSLWTEYDRIQGHAWYRGETEATATP